MATTTETPAQTETIGVISDVGAVAAALAAAFKAFDDLFAVMNSGPMLAARQRADVQNLIQSMDSDAKAAETNPTPANLAKLDAEVSG